MTDKEEAEEKRVVADFIHLFEKSKQLFNGLRDLPPYGHKQWQTYFGRAFDVYTRLWKYQQQHRAVLDRRYNLKRWQIGEIASRIGQLYYHYYLRTSETNYLNEAFQFYGAIRSRGYYSKREERGDLTVKKLRYFARFIVVCLLLKRMKNVRDLIRELSQHIDEYTSAYEPDDQLEWNLVLNEIRSFVEADSPVTIFDSNGEQVVLTYRLSTLSTPPVEKTAQMCLHLQEIVIVGTKSDQARFSELTMDMFRMLQTLEREPQTDGSAIPCLRRDNPHKHLLYKPTLDNLLVYLSSGWKDVELGGALLFYISGDPAMGGTDEIGAGSTGYYDSGGVSLTRKDDSKHSPRRSRYVGEPIQCLHPGDLVPFTRKPLFIIVESGNSHVFQDITSPFGAPIVILMSAAETPSCMHDHHGNGSLLTLFLHCPLTGFCMVTGLNSLTFAVWDIAQTYVDKFMTEGSRLFLQSERGDAYIDFFGDDFLRLLILRFIFFDTVLRYHRSFQSPAHHPRSHPELKLHSMGGTLSRIVNDLAQHLSVSKMFFDPES